MAQHLTNEIVSAAIEGFEAQKRRLDAQISELRTMLTPSRDGDTTESAPKKSRRRISAAGRARIAEAQRKRWAESKRQSAPPVNQEVRKPKRKLSAAGRKRISEATKRRWAMRRAEAAEGNPATTKKASGKPQKKAGTAAKETA
jgi:hypothetical protein